MPYQPHPALVRRLARKVVAIEAQAIRDLSLVDIGEELEGEFAAALGTDPADADWDALAEAVSDDICAATIGALWPTEPGPSDV
jgi:hypothetical protein